MRPAIAGLSLSLLVASVAFARVSDTDEGPWGSFQNVKAWSSVVKPDEVMPPTPTHLDGLYVKTEHAGLAAPDGALMAGITFRVRAKSIWERDGLGPELVQTPIEQDVIFNMGDMVEKSTGLITLEGDAAPHVGTYYVEALTLLWQVVNAQGGGPTIRKASVRFDFSFNSARLDELRDRHTGARQDAVTRKEGSLFRNLAGTLPVCFWRSCYSCSAT